MLYRLFCKYDYSFAIFFTALLWQILLTFFLFCKKQWDVFFTVYYWTIYFNACDCKNSMFYLTQAPSSIVMLFSSHPLKFACMNVCTCTLHTIKGNSYPSHFSDSESA